MSLIVCVAIPLAIGGLSAFITKDSMDIYEQINKPFLAPPGWLFPVAWTILYALMGYGSWLCLQAPIPRRTPALLIYGIQLAINFIWPIIFFNYQKWFLALAVLILLLFLAVTKLQVLKTKAISKLQVLKTIFDS